jgi:hypothetical protein
MIQQAFIEISQKRQKKVGKTDWMDVQYGLKPVGTETLCPLPDAEENKANVSALNA